MTPSAPITALDEYGHGPLAEQSKGRHDLGAVDARTDQAATLPRRQIALEEWMACQRLARCESDAAGCRQQHRID
jgi:hypothetical protein